MKTMMMMMLYKILIKERFIYEYDKNCLKDALHNYAENEPAMKNIEAVLKSR